MELKFKSIGQTSGFLNWLKGFKEIQPTLLIEVDLAENAFISKCFPPEKTIVKYSKISFADAGYELDGITDNDGKAIPDWKGFSSQRIKIGIFNVLPKFIDVVGMFGELDHLITVKFDEAIKNNATEYHAEDIQLKSTKSKLLSMKIKNCIINEFFIELSDDVFFKAVCRMEDPVTFNLTAETIKNLTNISSVFSLDPTRDAIKFYTKYDDGKLALYAYDETNDAYDYLLGYSDTADKIDASAVIFRKNFITAIKGMNDDFTLSLGASNGDRLLIDSVNSKTVVAGIQGR